LNGGIPSSIGNLTGLTYLNLNANMLNGSIPSAIGKLSNLQIVHLASNPLSGSYTILYW
jgi:Leucine-rich repeat (LRR) protein